MKLADNTDRHKISDEFEFQPDWTIDFGVTCPLVPKNPVFHHVRSTACLVLIGSLWKLQITCTGITSRTHSNSGKVRLFSLELLDLECQKKKKKNIVDFVWSVARLCNFYPICKKLVNKYDRYKTFNKLDWYLLWSYMFLIAGNQVSDRCP